MALFRKKKDRVLDLTERYRKQLEEETQKSAMENAQQQNLQGSQNTGMDFLGSMAGAQPRQLQAEDTETFGTSPIEERRRKLGKRLVDMTNQIENLSNQIYHLQQRIEVLERKAGVKIE